MLDVDHQPLASSRSNLISEGDGYFTSCLLAFRASDFELILLAKENSCIIFIIYINIVIYLDAVFFFITDVFFNNN